jgi:hypothetical protein
MLTFAKCRDFEKLIKQSTAQGLTNSSGKMPVKRFRPLMRCNLLDAQQRNALKGLRNIKGKVDFMLLNPPFSNRGAQRHKAEICGEQTACSLGVAFLIRTLPYLAPRGRLGAILPANTLCSEMDRSAWGIIDRYFMRSILWSNDERTFKTCHAKTVVVRLTRRAVAKNQTIVRKTMRLKPKETFAGSILIERGRVDMPSLTAARVRRGVPLVHTTELRNHRVDLSSRRVDAKRATLDCYAVLLPRIGHPNPDKICIHAVRSPVALSNCVLAIKCSSLREAKLLHRKLLGKWAIIKRAYTGTCAQYLTMARLRKLLLRIV